MKKVDKSLIVTLVVIILIYISSHLLTNAGIPCLIKKITHLYCPGCGISRMFISLFSLNFYQAFRYNPLMFTYLILFIVYVVVNLIRLRLKKKKLSLNIGVYAVLIIISIAFGILRNLPSFSYLLPTIVK